MSNKKPKFKVDVKTFTPTEFPYALLEDDVVIATFPTKKEADFKCEQLNLIYEESLILESEEDEELSFDDESTDEQPEETTEDVQEEQPEEVEETDVDEDPDSVTPDEVLTLNVANGFIYLAEQKKYAPSFIKASMTADEMTSWANEVLSSDTATKELSQKLGQSVEDIGEVKGTKSWLNSVISMADGVVEILKDKISSFDGLTTEEQPEEQPEETEVEDEQPEETEVEDEQPEETTDDSEEDSEEEDLEALFA